ncbi:MAG: hopanoid C-3 methylase HpnR [Candidatus Omnitrophica bacterium]|nr:hopanoid C-3 methylase HpnR [Candidatus Omnitrophota bacterium]
MKVLLVHPSPLLYSEIYLRLEPLGLEYTAEAVRRAGHEVRLLDLQIFTHRDFERELRGFQPDVVGFSVNYLANVPEVIDLAKQTKQCQPTAFVFCGGHSVSFIGEEVLEHAEGALDCVAKGEGESIIPALLENLPHVSGLPGILTADGAGPKAPLWPDLDTIPPARDLTRKRHRYFIGELDPCASIEFSRGCPWDCTFCSAWTFYNRRYRLADPERIAEEMTRIREPNVFIVDDVAFIKPEHSLAVAEALEKRGIRKRYYLETRCDVLLRNREIFAHWARLGLQYMFLGLESLDEEQLRLFRKRITPNQNFEALEVARGLGIDVAINLITDPGWDLADFQRAREWALAVPEIVHLTVATPYPGTELFHTENRQLITGDYRLFDIQHAVLPTRLPLRRFYEELVKTQSIINAKFMGWRTAVSVSRVLAGQLLRGQINFLRMLFKFPRIYRAERFYEDHFRPVRYALRQAQPSRPRPSAWDLMIHQSGHWPSMPAKTG